jgi:hypothetical protein
MNNIKNNDSTENITPLPPCPFCGSNEIKQSKYSDNVICECLKPSNTWLPRTIWIKRTNKKDS